MLRYVMRKKFKDSCNGAEGSFLYTIDGDSAAVERDLLSGGRSETGYDITELVGVEIISSST